MTDINPNDAPHGFVAREMSTGCQGCHYYQPDEACPKDGHGVQRCLTVARADGRAVIFVKAPAPAPAPGIADLTALMTERMDEADQAKAAALDALELAAQAAGEALKDLLRQANQRGIPCAARVSADAVVVDYLHRAI